jgi:hypothetical protein
MNGLSPHDILRDVAEALISTFYAMVSRMSDTQTSSKWVVDHWQCRHIPLGYQAELKLTLRYAGDTQALPTRRATDVHDEDDRIAD